MKVTMKEIKRGSLTSLQTNMKTVYSLAQSNHEVHFYNVQLNIAADIPKSYVNQRSNII